MLVLGDVAKHRLPGFQPPERPYGKRRRRKGEHRGHNKIYKEQHARFHLACPHLRAASKSLYGTLFPRMSR